MIPSFWELSIYVAGNGLLVISRDSVVEKRRCGSVYATLARPRPRGRVKGVVKLKVMQDKWIRV